jgi:peptide/nickel transport system substrate-binding protein
MFKAALFGRGRRLYGASWAAAPDSSFPQPMPLKSDPARAKQLLAEAGLPQGFSVPFAISTGQAATAEPLAALLKESLSRAGIQVDIQKKPDAEFNTLESQKTLPFFTDAATAWLPATYYYFYLYFTRDQRWNFASWKDTQIEDLAATARFEQDPAKYDTECKQMINIFADAVPLIMLWQPNHDAVMASNVEGYTYQFYRQADFRDLRRV